MHNSVRDVACRRIPSERDIHCLIIVGSLVLIKVSIFLVSINEIMKLKAAHLRTRPEHQLYRGVSGCTNLSPCPIFIG